MLRVPARARAAIGTHLTRLAAVIAMAVASSWLVLTGCTLPAQVVSVLFEPAPPPTEVVRKFRREPYKPPEVKKVVVEESPPAIDWHERYALLPKDANGNTDWVRALDEKLIEPKPGIDAKAEEQPVLDMDLELVPKDAPDFKVTYPHKIHTELFACTNCHTDIFQMEKGADPITMEKIFAGEYCGRCHGKVAFDPATGCPRCHRGMPQ